MVEKSIAWFILKFLSCLASVIRKKIKGKGQTQVSLPNIISNIKLI